MSDQLSGSHPMMLQVIVATGKKNDQIDAVKLVDYLRRDFLEACYMASTEIRERRRPLYRNLLGDLSFSRDSDLHG